jgi:hypothetical protein
MAPTKEKIWEYLLTPLNFPCIPRSPHHFKPCIWSHHVPRFQGQPNLASMHLSPFTKFIIKNNIVHKNVLITVFAFYLNGNNAWEWYCNFNPKEIKSFPYLVKKFQNY